MIDLENLKKYLGHLPDCNLNKDWTEAQNAFMDTPNQYRDDDWQIAYDQMIEKMNTCSCGLAEIIDEFVELLEETDESISEVGECLDQEGNMYLLTGDELKETLEKRAKY